MPETTNKFEFRDEVNFIETNAEAIVNRLIERFEEYTGETLFPADERRIFLQGFGYVMTDEENFINETGRQNLLRYADGNRLDAIGDLYANPRLEAEKATVVLQFKISAAQETELVIPKGTRVTVDGVYTFVTVDNLIFEAKTEILTKEVEAEAVNAGSAYNDFVAGQINKMVDSNPYVEEVKNTTTSSGGTDIEDDESYRERLQLSPFNFSVAGPSESYRSIALSVSNRIGDIHVYSPSAGTVEIVVIENNGVIPDIAEELITEIYLACSAKNVRPLTDLVQVVPATAVNTTLEVQYYVANGDISTKPAIEAAVEEYKAWQMAKIGRAINPDKLRSMMMEAGAARVRITTPAFAEIAENEVAQFASTTVTYAGSVTF